MMFVFMVLSVIIFMNYYIYRGLILLLELPLFWINILKISIIFICLAQLIFIAFFRYKSFPDILYLIGASMLGVSFMLFSVALIYDIFYIGVQKFPFDEERRVFFRKFLTYSTLVMIFLYIFRGFLGGVKEPKIKNIVVNIKNLSKEMNLVQLTDIHIGKILGGDFLEDLVKKVNNLKPDFVVITGDLVDLEISLVKKELDILKKLKSKYGTFFVAGNHEYYHGVDEILEYLDSIGIFVLRNSSKTLDTLNICGVYDLASFRLNHHFKPNLQESLKKIDKNLPTILLTHQPKFIETFDTNTPVDLVLSGHTHGGQIFPFGLLVRLAQPYLYGLYKHNKKTQIYVSSGAGYWGPPIRFLAPSEIVNIKLNPKTA